MDDCLVAVVSTQEALFLLHFPSILDGEVDDVMPVVFSGLFLSLFGFTTS